MSFIIAVTGKGGVGKTTVSGLLIQQLIANNYKPVLAVDADPNSCLDSALGVKIIKTIGSAREEAREEASKGLAAGISKQQMLEIKITESLVESKDFDMISMGRPEGEGCYCYANNVLRQVIAQISSSYKYVVIDNEAGLENLSRRIVQKVNVLAVVSDASSQGLKTVHRLYNLAHEMKIKYDKLIVIINRTRNDSLPEFASELKNITNADVIIALPYDEELAINAEKGLPLNKISEENKVLKGVNEIVRKIML